MNKGQLVERVSETLGLSKTEVDRVLRTAQEIATDALLGGDDVYLRGLGRLEVVELARRPIFNPQDGETYIWPQRKTLRFRISTDMRWRLRQT